ncbi:MAG: formyltransferase family protein [Casimicrobiaceae bacterium]
MNATVLGDASARAVRLRTVFCTCGGLYGALVLERLRASPYLEICGIVRSSRVLDPNFGFLQGAMAQIRRSGLRYALYLWCTTTLADALCALNGLGNRTRAGDAAARRLTTRDVNDAEGRAFVAACAADLLISSFFNQRLALETLAVPALACLNIHPSLLPDAKGVDPVFQALLHGGPPLGVTVHFMNAEFDAGKILAQRPVEPPSGASVFETTALLYRDGADLLASAVDRVATGDRGVAQSGPGSYQSWPTAGEIAALRRQGGALLRFKDLVRLARARLPR